VTWRTQNRSINVAFAEGHIINAEDTRDWVSRKLSTVHNPEQGIPAGSETQLCGDTCGGTATECKAEHFEGAREPLRPLGTKRHELGKAFGKGSPRTRRRITKEPTHMQVELNVVVADGEVTRRRHIPTVDAGRQLLAIWTGHVGTDGSCFNQQFSIACMDSINHKPS
jgi:hypothetical protein